MDKSQSVEVAGIPLILVGRSGENIGQTQIQVWEKVTVPQYDKTARRATLQEGHWALLVILSALFIVENILVSGGLVTINSL